MTKRQGNGLYNHTNKKSKFDDDLDHLWGDDPAIEDIDDCLLLAATQISQETLNETRINVSILPSYSGFQGANNLQSSTQNKIGNSFLASTSSTVFKKPGPIIGAKESLQLRIYKLEEELQTKDGEVSILRNKLNTSKTATEAEFAKRQKEFVEKHDKTNKELKLYKCELEFKNLEIANLTKKFSDLVKYNQLNSSIVIEGHDQTTRNVTVSKTIHFEVGKEFKTSHRQHIFYPLKISEALFTNRKQEMYIPISNGDRVNINLVPLLETENMTVIKRPTIKYTLLKDKSFLNSGHILPYFISLSKCNNLELDRRVNEKHINKILFVLNLLLENMQEFLREVDENMQPDMVAKLNSLFLENKFELSENNITIYDNREWCENELGINCRQIIMLLVTIIPYMPYLKLILLENKSINSNGEIFDRFEIKSQRYDILQKILNITNLIGKVRLSYIYPGFLSSVAILAGILIDLSEKRHLEFLYNLLREVVFTKPSAKVLIHITNVLKEIKSMDFLNLFCEMPEINGLRTRPKKNFVLFSRDCCIMQVFCNLYTNQILNGNDFPKYLQTDLIVVSFICNLFKHNLKWLSCKNNNHEQCTFCICRISVRIMLKNLQNIADYPLNSLDKHHGKELFQCSLQLLRLLNFNSYAVIQGNFRLLTDYHKIISILEAHKHLLSIGGLDTSISDLSSVYTDEPSETLDGFKFNQKYWSKKIL